MMTRIPALRALPALTALLCLPLPSYGWLNNTSPSAACTHLQSILGTGIVILPSEEGYQAASQENWCVSERYRARGIS